VPVAPPLPFAYMGSYTPDSSAPVFFLTAGRSCLHVRVGETLNDTYSVDSFINGQLVMTTASQIQQQLTVGERSVITLTRRITAVLAAGILVAGCAADRLHRQGLPTSSGATTSRGERAQRSRAERSHNMGFRWTWPPSVRWPCRG